MLSPVYQVRHWEKLVITVLFPGMHNKAVRLVLAVNLLELFLHLRPWKNINRLCLTVNFSVKLTFSQHAHRQTFHKSAGLTGFPPSLGDFTFIGRWAAVFNIPCRKERGETTSLKTAVETMMQLINIIFHHFVAQSDSDECSCWDCRLNSAQMSHLASS